MKTLISVVTLGALALAGAARAGDNATVSYHPQPSVHQVWIEDLEPYQREYQLSNGDVLTLSKRSGSMYAQLNSGEWHRIVATGRGSFAALDGTFTIHIDLIDDDNASGWLSPGPDSDARLAGELSKTSHLASTR